MGNHDVYIGSAPIRIEVSGAQGPAGRVTVSETAPSDTTAGWLDPSDGTLAYYIGGAWVTTGTGEVVPEGAYVNGDGAGYANASGHYYSSF